MYYQANDPGFGEKFFKKTKRIINKDGSFNVTRIDGGFSSRDLYQFLINLSWPKFLLIILAAFIVVNSFFAGLYELIEFPTVQKTLSGNLFILFLDDFFFSVQTFTTVGYGGILPQGMTANFISSFEALLGLLSFALATGLLYGRFSKPTGKIIYSKKAVIAPYKDGIALQFRIANQRHNILMEMEARVLIVFLAKKNDQYVRKYYDLKLEMPFIYFFPLSWTVVHKIDEDSPLYGKTEEDLKELETELLILIKAFDDTFSQHVHSRFSYRHDEIIWGARYKRAFYTEDDGEVILELDAINDYENVDLPINLGKNTL
jgi:inward rectifier potassium channel